MMTENETQVAHTPGPWSVGFGRVVEFEGSERCYAVGIDGDPWTPIAVLSFESAKQPRDEANARLIAAAPELLGELRRLIAACEVVNRNGVLTDLPSALADAQALVERIEGK